MVCYCQEEDDPINECTKNLSELNRSTCFPSADLQRCRQLSLIVTGSFKQRLAAPVHTFHLALLLGASISFPFLILAAS